MESLEARRLLAIDAGGADVTIDVAAGTIAITAGQVLTPDGSDDVGLSNIGTLTIQGDVIGDVASIGGDADAGDLLTIAGVNAGAPIAIRDVSSLIYNAAAGDDLFTFDVSSAVPTTPVTFNGQGEDGDNGGDQLSIIGTVTTQTILYAAPSDDGNSGVIDLDGTVLTYSGMEPINAGDSAETVLSFDTGLANDGLLQNSKNAGFIEIIDNGATFESTVIPNPANSLTINFGDQGDTLNVTTLDESYAASMILNGGVGTDQVQFTGVTISDTAGRGLDVAGVEALGITASTISGNSADVGGGLRVIGGTTTINGSTFIGNTATGDETTQGGGAIFNDGVMTIISSTISGNSASGESGSGGGILNGPGGTLSVLNSTVRENVASLAGGGIETQSSNFLTLAGVTLESNRAISAVTDGLGDGGGLHVTGDANVIISGGVIRGNFARAEGGGLWNDLGTMTINGGTLIESNRANGDASFFDGTTTVPTDRQGGGGIFNHLGTLEISDDGGSVVLSNNSAFGFQFAGGGGILSVGGEVRVVGAELIGNVSTGAGGGLFNLGDATLDRSTLSGNRTGTGAGVFNSGVMAIANSTLHGNEANSDGGGIFSDGTLSVTNSSIAENEARYGGGIENSGEMTIASSTISGNTSDLGSGAGIYNDGTLKVVGSTISGNTTSSGRGGGLYNRDSLTVVNSTISGNSARVGGGLYSGSRYGPEPKTTLLNTILAGNRGSFTYRLDDIGGLDLQPTSANNLLGDPDSSGGLFHDADDDPTSGGNNVVGQDDGADGRELLDLSSLLGPLAFNGGPTQTHALVSGSAAIDAGDNALAIDADGKVLANDQRGHPFGRIVDAAVDIGAFEAQLLDDPFFVVTTLADELDYTNSNISLREAIANAGGNAGSEQITFDASLTADGQATIELTLGEISISSALSITGPGAQLLTIDAQQQSRVFNVDDEDGNLIDVNISGLTLSGGIADRGFSRLTLAGSGGAILSMENLTITDSVITANIAQYDGGGLFNRSGTMTITRSTVSDNVADRDGGGIFNSLFANSVVTITDSTLSGNIAQRFGGGLAGDYVNITNSSFSENEAQSGGGLWSSRRLTIAGSSISGNTASQSGGGVWTTGGQIATIVDSAFTENSADHGGALFNHGTLTLDATTIADNFARNTGGGLLNELGTTTVTSSTVSENSATIDGGGVLNQSGTVSFINSTISGNTTNGAGGGVFNRDAIVVANSTIAGNTAANAGGGLFNNGGLGAVGTLNNTIVVGNRLVDGDPSDIGGPGIESRSANNLIGDPNSSGGLLHDADGDPNFGRNNIVGQDSGDGGRVLLDGSTILGPLALNAGPTRTHALLEGSPAVDAGNDALSIDADGNLLSTDQRGRVFSRIAGAAVDIGAYEQQQLDEAFFVVTTLADESEFSNDDVSLREAIISAIGSFDTVDITFSEALTENGPATIPLSLGQLPITSSIVITGPGADSLTIDAQQQSRIFYVDDGLAGDSVVSISGITLTGGSARTGGAIVSRESLTITGTTVRLNHAEAQGGGIWIDQGTLTINGGTRIEDNVAEGLRSGAFIPSSDLGGGGIFNDGGTLDINDDGGSVTITNNQALGFSDGGGILSLAGDVTVTGSTVSGNTAESDGGGVLNNGSLTLTDGTISGNVSRNSGGGLSNDGMLSLIRSTLSENTAEDGGGVYNSGELTAIETTVSANEVKDDGGGVFNSGTLTLTDTTVSENRGERFGGGLSNFRTMTLNNSVISENNGGTGGGIFSSIVSTLIVTNSTISGNTAESDGGGLDLDGTVSLIGTTISDNISQRDGAGFFNNGNVSLISSTVIGNTANGSFSSGGAIKNNEDLAITDSIISLNTAMRRGGGVYSTGGTVSITDSSITGNRAEYGGGIHNDETLIITDSTVSGNSSEEDGGGIYSGSSSTVTLAGVSLANNAAGHIGGGLFSDGVSLITGSTVVGNSSFFLGGGLFNTETMTVDTSTVSENTSEFSGGGAYNSGTLTIADSSVSGNRADEGGGLINRFTLGTIKIMRTSVTGNTASSFDGGGGVRVDEGQFTAIESTLSDNRGYNGGAISATKALVTLVNSTVSSNSASDLGGGLFSNGASIRLVNATITRNVAETSGGGLYLQDTFFPPESNSSLLIHNSIVAANTSLEGHDFVAPDDAENTLVVAFSLIGNNAETSLTEAQQADASGNFVGSPTRLIDPLLGPLADTGGPTQTHPLLVGSPAIDAGSNTLAVDFGEDDEPGGDDDTPLVTDQRSGFFFRTFESDGSGVVDIGAHEFQPEPRDFGDAPSQYPVRLADDGARHVPGSLRLGASITNDADGQPSPAADSDGDSDDGVLQIADAVSVAGASTTSSFLVTASEPGQLNAWIDFNIDGDWDDQGEQIAIAVVIPGGSTVLSYTVPSGATSGFTAARFRLSTAAAISPTGEAADGEVEDYIVEILDGDVSPDAHLHLPNDTAVIEIESENIIISDGVTNLFAAPPGVPIAVLGGDADDSITLNFDVGPEGGLSLDGLAGANRLVVHGTLIDFTDSGLVHAQNFSAVDMSDSLTSVITIDAAAVSTLSPTDKTIVITGVNRDVIAFKDAPDWRMADRMIVDGRFIQSIANQVTGELVRIDLPASWQNMVEPADVSNDGSVTAFDALLIINELGRRTVSNATTQELFDPLILDPSVYYDLNGDGLATALDALRVVNQIARLPNSIVGNEGESKSAFDRTLTIDADADDTSDVRDDRPDWVPANNKRTNTPWIPHGTAERPSRDSSRWPEGEDHSWTERVDQLLSGELGLEELL